MTTFKLNSNRIKWILLPALALLCPFVGLRAQEPSSDHSAAFNSPQSEVSCEVVEQSKATPAAAAPETAPTVPTPVWEATFAAPPTWLLSHRGIVAVGSQFASRIAAYDPTTGLLIWDLKLYDPVSAPPLITDDSLIAVSKDCSVFSIDCTTGETKSWILPFPYDKLINQEKELLKTKAPSTAPGQQESQAQLRARTQAAASRRRFTNQLMHFKLNTLPELHYSSPLAYRDKYFCISSNGMTVSFSGPNKDGSSLNPSETEWQDLDSSGISNKGFISTPVIFSTQDDDYLYAITLDGTLWVADMEILGLPLSIKVGEGQHEFRLPLHLVHDLVYAISSQGTIFCYSTNTASLAKDRFTPKLLWKFSGAPLNSYQTNQRGQFIGDPTFEPGKPRLFMAVQNKVWAISKLSGSILWGRPIEECVATPVLYVRDNVLVTTETGKLLVLDAPSGQIKRSHVLPFVPACPLETDGERLFIGNMQGKIVCYNLADLL